MVNHSPGLYIMNHGLEFVTMPICSGQLANFLVYFCQASGVRQVWPQKSILRGNLIRFLLYQQKPKILSNILVLSVSRNYLFDLGYIPIIYFATISHESWAIAYGPQVIFRFLTRFFKKALKKLKCFIFKNLAYKAYNKALPMLPLY